MEEKQPLLTPIMRWFMVAIVLANIAGSMYQMFMPIYLTDLGASIGQVGLVFTASSVVMLFLQILGGWISDTIGRLRAIAIGSIGGVLGFLAMLAAVIRIWMARNMLSPERSKTGPLSIKSLSTSVKTMMGFIIGGGVITWIFITDGVRDIAFSLSSDIQPIYLEQVARLTVQEIGILGAIFSIAMMSTPMISGKISDEYGERVPISGGFLLIFAAYTIFLNANTFLVFAITWVVFGLGVGMLSPAYQSLISKVVPQKMLGTFTGLFQSSRGVISLPAPYLGAKLWEWFNPKLPFMITAGTALVTIIPTWLFFKVTKDKSTPSETTSDISASKAEI